LEKYWENCVNSKFHQNRNTSYLHEGIGLYCIIIFVYPANLPNSFSRVRTARYGFRWCTWHTVGLYRFTTKCTASVSGFLNFVGRGISIELQAVWQASVWDGEDGHWHRHLPQGLLPLYTLQWSPEVRDTHEWMN